LNSSTDFRKRLPRYLLGELSPEEIAEIDEKYLGDDSFADALEESRHDLLDRLVAGELSANERSRVEKLLAQMPQYEGALRVARALHARQGGSRTTERKVRTRVRRPFWIWAAATVVLSLATLAVFVKRHSNLISPQTLRTSGTMPAPSTVSPTHRQGAEDELAFVVLLSPEVSRGADGPESVAIPGAARYVEFQIVLPASNEKTRYETRVSADSKKEPLIISDLEAKSLGLQRYLEFRAPADSLPPGRYSVHVFAQTMARPLLARYDLRLTQSPR
jgi:Putative zinc-finger